MAKKAKAEPAVLELPVAFSNVSIGDKTCRVGVTVSRVSLTVSQADKNLCGRRLTGKLVPLANGDAPGQTYMDGTGPAELAGIFDVKGFSATTKHIGFGLTFMLEGLDLTTIAGLAKRDGSLIVNDIQEIPEEDGKSDEE